MSKKIIGPALPPHLQHLVESRHSDGDSSKSPRSPPLSRTPNNSVEDEEEDDSVLVLNVSDDELSLEGPRTLKQTPNAVMSVPRRESASSDEGDAFGPPLPSGLKAGAQTRSVPKSAGSRSDTAGNCERSEDDEDSFGPVLSPDMKTHSRGRRSRKSHSSDEVESFGPVVPPNFKMRDHSKTSRSSAEDDTFGPVLPSDMKTNSGRRSKTSRSSSDEEDPFGPVLPPNFKIPTPSKTSRFSSDEEDPFGPVLPPNYKIPTPSNASPSSDEEDSFGPPPPPDFGPAPAKVIGPTLPPPHLRLPAVVVDPSEPDQSDDDVDDVVGPMPPTHDPGVGASYAQQLLDARAIRMKRKLAGEDDDASSRVVARETWMLELPPDRSSEFGLGPRQFRARAKLDLGDRSVWTDTPVDKEHRANAPQRSEATSTVDLKSETEMIAIAERDRAMQKLTDKHNKKKKRKESLVDLHQKKLKKKQKKEEEDGKPKERRPFDRNLDLQANRFDEAQKKAILRKAQLLDDRFSRGETKFL